MLQEQVKKVVKNWEKIRAEGAFVFDIDETLMGPDDSLEAHLKLGTVLGRLLQQGVTIGIISGGPAAVVTNRIINPLTKILKENLSSIENLVLYANGGSSKYRFNLKGVMSEDVSFAKKNKIDFSLLEAVKAMLQDSIQQKFGYSDEDFRAIAAKWKARAKSQWGELPSAFKGLWELDASRFKLNYIDDVEMAKMKAGQISRSFELPFINTRGVRKDSSGKVDGVAGFSITGFYSLRESEGDGQDLDIREKIMNELHQGLIKRGDRLSMRKAGRSSIDVTASGTDKAAALQDLLQSNHKKTDLSYYFGDEFFVGGNDQPVADSSSLNDAGLTICSVNKSEAPVSPNVLWIGRSYHATQLFLATLIEQI